ncbi:hypothetical protein FB567DRAFT_259816 [Paraphoma chrysanthemicola]|uniref:Rhodopsin domain-containing protein n=1 Tax=Paraphoma chrysanthemicola TaxID=798071 RepID=A0A8K0QRE7_9PLEO|nr:hypothetical protein FB567DRAFT_259816 [Paraphoma chrysanthemicola]
MSSPDTVGALPAPPGIEPNFENPESIAYRVIIVAVIGPVIAIPICGLRLYTKRYILRNTGWDDHAIALAVLLALGFSILTGYQTTNGLGNHIWDVPSYKFHALMKIGDIAGPIFYNISTLFIKVSLCLFYLRLSPFLGFRVAVYAVMVVSIIYSLLAAFGFAWVCQPIEKYWDFSITTGSCINLTAFFLATACINAGTDLTLLVLPLFIIKDLRLPMRRKIGVGLLLMTGSFVCVVSLIRVQIVVKGMHTTTVDGTWGMVANFNWLLIEMWLGIVCTCLPALHTFFRRRFGKNESGHVVPLPAVRDPNSDRVDPNVVSDSGYESGELTGLSLGTIDVESQSNRRSGVRPVASDKSLLATVSRCDD